ncbi:PqqD family protein [Streptomyces sp. BE20]|uniref:PqqD family protein n=1 Tax=Streptomyces sp. BE20 TaxID=3002525 RepID=UPI002E76519C|nr:PqqD family protein [Streptomyces sp. BE20]MEE1820723.1 PqqD family protein [Streptomyces sp. BE20]
MLTVAPGVHHAHVGGQTAILNVGTGGWVMLDPAASRIWQAIVLRGGVEGLAEEIAIPSGADTAAVHRVIGAAVNGMVDRGLLTDPGALRVRRPWRRKGGGR